MTVDDAETSDDPFRNESTERTQSDAAADSDPENGEDIPVSPAAPDKVGHCHSHPTGNRRQRRAAAKRTRTLRAYTDPATAAGSAEHPGFLDGYGVISADHARNLLTSSGVRVHVLGNRIDATGAVIPLPCTQPADPYRPSTALQTFVRARDQYCVWPGCDRAATKSDLDHAVEHDHDHPSAGGQTTPDGLVALCRFHHLVKTFSTFMTDVYVGPDGRIRTTVTTPEGLTVDGPVHTGEDLHPGLTDIEFAEPPNAPPGPDDRNDEPIRPRTRLAEKYACRRRSVTATDYDARTSSTTNPNHRSERGATSGCRP